MDYRKISLLSFDCYGTLIDWKESVLNILKSFFADSPMHYSREELFRAFLEADRAKISDTYRSYREILAEVFEAMAEDLRFSMIRVQGTFYQTVLLNGLPFRIQ